MCEIGGGGEVGRFEDNGGRKMSSQSGSGGTIRMQ